MKTKLLLILLLASILIIGGCNKELSKDKYNSKWSPEVVLIIFNYTGEDMKGHLYTIQDDKEIALYRGLKPNHGINIDANNDIRLCDSADDIYGRCIDEIYYITSEQILNVESCGVIVTKSGEFKIYGFAVSPIGCP